MVGGPGPVGKTAPVAFGQQLGPPASAKQVQELLTLLKAAGHTDFRDARGPMGFTQRQAGGRFARDEADQFIDRLRREESDLDTESAPDEVPAAPPPSPRPARPGRALAQVPAEHLADELRHRGWTVVKPG
jgi:hypothetical protein